MISFYLCFLYSCNSFRKVQRLSGSKFPDYSQCCLPPFSPLFNHFAIDIYSLNIFCNSMYLFPSSLRNLSQSNPMLCLPYWLQGQVSILNSPLNSGPTSTAFWNIRLHTSAVAPLNTYQSKQVIPTPPPHLAQTCSLLLSFVHHVITFLLFPSRGIPGRHPLLHLPPASSSQWEQQSGDPSLPCSLEHQYLEQIWCLLTVSLCVLDELKFYWLYWWARSPL